LVEKSIIEVMIMQKADRCVKRVMRDTGSVEETFNVLCHAIAHMFAAGPPEKVTDERLDELLEGIRARTKELIEHRPNVGHA
jgi:hypothetical protein